MINVLRRRVLLNVRYQSTQAPRALFAKSNEPPKTLEQIDNGGISNGTATTGGSTNESNSNDIKSYFTRGDTLNGQSDFKANDSATINNDINKDSNQSSASDSTSVSPLDTSKMTSPSSSVSSSSSLSSPSSSSSSSPPPPPPVYFHDPNQSNSSSNKYVKHKETAKAFAYVASAVCLCELVFAQYERLDESERQMKVMKKNQKELVNQMQTYKKKINKASIETTKRDIIIQGKMQTHIALLREQLIQKGVDPVSIDEALERFEEEVRVAVTPSSVDLWVPGESPLKALIPDPHEYDQKKK